MKKRYFLVLALLTVLTAAGAGFAVAPHVQSMLRPAGEMFPAWALSFTDLDEMVVGVDAVVLATAQASSPGRVAYGSGDSVPVPFTLVDFRVDEVLRGDVGPTLTLERTGGDWDSNAFYFNGDGGAYAVGDQVLLFLNRQPETDQYYLVNPQGRFGIAGGRLDAAAPDDPVAQRLDRLTLIEARERISRAF